LSFCGVKNNLDTNSEIPRGDAGARGKGVSRQREKKGRHIKEKGTQTQAELDLPSVRGGAGRGGWPPKNGNKNKKKRSIKIVDFNDVANEP